ncbi:hypothetical protein P9B99_10430, partial [Bacillus paralicheniformis]
KKLLRMLIFWLANQKYFSTRGSFLNTTLKAFWNPRPSLGFSFSQKRKREPIDSLLQGKTNKYLV